jgi:hypothetical protein
MFIRIAPLFFFVVFAGACSGGSTSSSPPGCVPGSTQTCFGPGACSGAQVCAADGASYGACDCGADAGTDSAMESSIADSTTDSIVADTGVDTSADTPIEPISPDKLPGLSLWLDGDKGVTLSSGGFVQGWKDQSSHGNDVANCSGIGQEKGDIKGHDAVAFIGGNCRIEDDPSLQFGTGGFALMVVVKPGGAGAQPNVLFGKYAGMPQVGMRLDIQATANLFAGAYPPGTPIAEAHAYVAPSVYHLVIARGPDLELRVDGVTSKGTKSTYDVSGTGSFVVIGGSGSSDTTQMNVAEYVAVKGALTDDQVLGVEAYFKNRYKFTW